MAPAQRTEAGESPVGAEPSRVVLNRISGQVCVCDIVSPGIDFGSELSKRRPVAFSGADHHGTRRSEQRIDGRTRVIQTHRLSEDSAVSHYPQETTKRQVRQTERLIIVGEPLKQQAVLVMLWQVQPMRIHKNIHINATHRAVCLRPSPRQRWRWTTGPHRAEAHPCRLAVPHKDSLAVARTE